MGIAVGDGSLALDDEVADFVPQWRGTASADVTIRNLLANDSGRTIVVRLGGASLQAQDNQAFADAAAVIADAVR